ncbi:hypothetical protein J3R83DRAFT_6003 [Lanmaoa asiatica]|nr:hypothetical protein J3R83DRAFT_6003 [Lanmaoa asiatica]
MTTCRWSRGGEADGNGRARHFRIVERQVGSVWNDRGGKREKVIEVRDINTVYVVDISADSTRFATGTAKASIWSITTGQELVGLLGHNNDITGIKFSPDGDHIATACYGGLICVFDSHNGDKLVTVKTNIRLWYRTPLAWSGDGQKIFTTSSDNKIRSFNVSTGSQLAESLILYDGYNFNHYVHSPARYQQQIHRYFCTAFNHSPGHINTLADWPCR